MAMKRKVYLQISLSLFLLLIWQEIGGRIVEEIKVFFGLNLTRWDKTPGTYMQQTIDITQFLYRAQVLRILSIHLIRL